MASIRSYLAFRLLAGFVLLLTAASVLIYFISKQILQADFDARLFAKAQAVIASTSQKGDGLDIDWSNLPHEVSPRGGQSLFQIVNDAGNSLGGEPFLKTALPPASDHPYYKNATSLQGEKLRVVVVPFLPSVEEEDTAITPPNLRKPCSLIVGSDREQLEHALHLMAGVLAGMTFLTSILSLGIVVFVVRQGLEPLAVLSSEVAQIDEATLERRIDLHSLPNEVFPIAEKLNGLLSRLEISFARERRFSGDVSHELRTPVAELKTMSEVMLQLSHQTPETRQAFENTLAIACQLESLVTVLLELVREEQGRSTLTLTDVDIQSVMKTTRRRYEAKAEQKKVEINEIPGMGGLHLRADPRLLTLIFSNLFDNAVEYSPAGGQVEIEFKPDKKPPCVVISNSTENLAPADLPHIFERFWRKDKARGESGHFGIGLALTRTLCQRLGIHLSVSMDKGNLVRFWLYLPEKGGVFEK